MNLVIILVAVLLIIAVLTMGVLYLHLPLLGWHGLVFVVLLVSWSFFEELW